MRTKLPAMILGLAVMMGTKRHLFRARRTNDAATVV
jgi:hypothetical protein